MKYIILVFTLWYSFSTKTISVGIDFPSYFGDTTITDTVIGPAYKGKWIKMGEKVIIEGPFTLYAKSKGGTPPFVPDVVVLAGTDRTIKD
ncbi:MAG: hypothetical protein ABIR66_03865 [Saprospiraceae bacterium]